MYLRGSSIVDKKMKPAKLSNVFYSYMLIIGIVNSIFESACGQCDDIPGKVEFQSVQSIERREVSCSWVKKGATRIKCSYDKISSHCRKTCGICEESATIFVASATSRNLETSSNPSSKPSTIPSASPSDCVDEPNWQTLDPKGVWSGKTCSEIGELAFWCSYLAPYVYNNKGTYEACCGCGGGDHVPVPPSERPSISPSPTQCADDPDWFWDASNGYGCESVIPSLCSHSNINKWYNGKNAQLACCICGGGNHAPFEPSSIPTSMPSTIPSILPTLMPSTNPSVKPSSSPSILPSTSPSNTPTSIPSSKPSILPSSIPTSNPSLNPSLSPSETPTVVPSTIPSAQPSNKPSTKPSQLPTNTPSISHSAMPSTTPSNDPSSRPSRYPSITPSFMPSKNPSSIPTMLPSSTPSEYPSSLPSILPSSTPSKTPSTRPSNYPTSMPTLVPSFTPSSIPSIKPSSKPSSSPSLKPSLQLSSNPSMKPSSIPSKKASSSPSVLPSSFPSLIPSSNPSSQPSSRPSIKPSSNPSLSPTSFPSSNHSSDPSAIPSSLPTTIPTESPSEIPTSNPSSNPSENPSLLPSYVPSSKPSVFPSSKPSLNPTLAPSSFPSVFPSTQPSVRPSSIPSTKPSNHPSFIPSIKPSSHPSETPSIVPTLNPSSNPSSKPSTIPSASPSDCVDEPNWQTLDPKGVWSGKTCSEIGELAFWCSYLAPYVYNNKGTYEACCGCGGGDHVPVPPSERPSISPSPTQCADDPDWFWDASNGYGCESVSSSFCNDSSINVWYNGKNAQLACCVCGGGNHIPLEPSSLPSLAPSSKPVNNLPGFVGISAPSISPSIYTGCSINEFIGHQFFVPFASSCYKIELFPNGVLAVDSLNKGCSNENFVNTATLSIFDYAYNDEIVFREGDLGWKGIVTIRQDSTKTDIGVDIESINNVAKEFDLSLLFPACSMPSVSPSSSSNNSPTSNIYQSAEPSLLANTHPSSSPSIIKLCSIDNFIGREFFIPFASSCYKIELFPNGVLAVDSLNKGCSNENFVNTATLSIFDYAYNDEIVFREGDLGWKGIVTIRQDSTKTDIGVDIESINNVAKEFDLSLLFPACSMPSVSPSSSPSKSIAPSVSPTECIDDSNWYWSVANGYGCAQVSTSFCSDLSIFWYNGKNSYSACCVCGGGAHTY